MRPAQVRRFAPAAGAGIERALGPVRRGEARGDVGAGAETGIEQALPAQPAERRLVQVQAPGLPGHRPVPAQAEPFEVPQDRLDMLGPGAGAVDILDAQGEAAAMRPRVIVRLDRRPGMAQVQAPRRARRESRVDNHQTGP